MQFLYFIMIIVVLNLIYIPIEKKYKFNKRYKNKENHHFRLIIVIIGVIGIVGELYIGFSSLETNSLLRNSLEILFGIPMIFTLFVANPLVNYEK